MRILLTIAVFYIAYCCLLFVLQRRILFPRHFIGSTPGQISIPSGMERIWLHTSYGKVEAWFLPPVLEKGFSSAPAVIFAHGNAELIDFWPLELKAFSSLGVGLLLVEYPGYGRSEGTPSEKTIVEAFMAAYDSLVARKDVDPARIVFWGRSLGGGAVCALAKERQPAALILMSTFTSVRSMTSKFLAPGFLVRDPFDNLAVIQSYAGPVLVVHGRHDDLIPYAHGQKLYQAARQGEMVTYDCQHNDCPPSWTIFRQDVAAFLGRAGIIPDEARRETE